MGTLSTSGAIVVITDKIQVVNALRNRGVVEDYEVVEPKLMEYVLDCLAY